MRRNCFKRTSGSPFKGVRYSLQVPTLPAGGRQELAMRDLRQHFRFTEWWKTASYFLKRRLATPANPTNPVPNKSMLAGSGTSGPEAAKPVAWVPPTNAI
jgi:hypothetical protein